MDNSAKKVLLVEDSRVISKILVHTIRSRAGLEVECATTLDEARQVLDAHPEGFFIAILDMCLSDAPNGEIVDFVIDRGVLPIVLTNSLSDDRHDEMMGKTIIDYVVKRNLNEIDYIVQTIVRLKENQQRKVLIVDDSKASRVLISTLLRRHYLNVLEAGDGEEALSVIAENRDITLVISDYNMPKMDGLELTTKIRDTYSPSEMAIIGISTIGAGSISVKFLKSGANDFIARPFLHEEFYCRINQSIDAISSFRSLKELSNRDQLTNLYNRNYLFLMGKKLLQNAQRKNITLTMAVFDIDDFKEINNKHGHDVGDAVLKHVSSLLLAQMRDSDIIARIGSEEFCLLSVNLEEENTEAAFERFRNAISETPLTVDYLTLNSKISIGYTTVLKETLDEMLNDADAALLESRGMSEMPIMAFN